MEVRGRRNIDVDVFEELVDEEDYLIPSKQFNVTDSEGIDEVDGPLEDAVRESFSSLMHLALRRVGEYISKWCVTAFERLVRKFK